MNLKGFGTPPELKPRDNTNKFTKSAFQIKKNQMSGSAMTEILRPMDPHKKGMMKRGVTEKDFLKENNKLLRQKQQQIQQSKQEGMTKSVPFKIKRFERVKACVSSNNRKPSSSGIEEASHSPIPYSCSDEEEGDHIRHHSPFIRKDELESDDDEYETLGDAKETFMAQETHEYHDEPHIGDHNNNNFDKGIKIPAGPRILSETERLEGLNNLYKKKQDAENDRRKLPLLIETDGQKRREQAIETRLRDIEKAIEDFSQPVVAVEE